MDYAENKIRELEERIAESEKRNAEFEKRVAELEKRNDELEKIFSAEIKHQKDLIYKLNERLKNLESGNENVNPGCTRKNISAPGGVTDFSAIIVPKSEKQAPEKNFLQLNQISGGLRNSPVKSPLITSSRKTSVSIAKNLSGTNPTKTSLSPKTPVRNLAQKTSSAGETNFVSEFNALSAQSGFAARQAEKDFLQKYEVSAFNCTNFEARVDEPIPPPIFSGSENARTGEYWAVHVQNGLYAVLPNVKTYTDNYHSARAMGEVFDSNFVAGRTYGKIFVEKPAVFVRTGNDWKLKQKGKLRLE